MWSSGSERLCFIAKIYYLKQLKEKPIPEPSDSPLLPGACSNGPSPTHDTRHFLGYILFYNIAAFMCLPFQIKYLKALGYGAGFIVAANSMVSVGAIVSLRFWGKSGGPFRQPFDFRHFTHRPHRRSGRLGAGGKQSFSAVLVFVLYGAWSIFQSANGIAQTRHMFHTVPENDQSNMVIINAFVFISIAMAPMISGLFLKLSADWHFESGGLSINHYHMLFLLASALVLIPHRVCKKFQNNVETSAVEVFVVVTRPLRMLFGSFVSFPTKRNRGK